MDARDPGQVFKYFTDQASPPALPHVCGGHVRSLIVLCFWKRTWAILNLGMGTPQCQPHTGSPGLKMEFTPFWGSATGLLIAKATPGMADVKQISWNEIVG